MRIIRDNEAGGLLMIPLLVDWHIRRCNQRGCTAKPTTIIADIADVPIFGLCEQCFQQGNQPGGGKNYELVWDDFDALK
mgnify:CR=1 FL=1